MLSGIDPTSDRPVYRQIAAALRSAIAHGELGPGDRLPSESELMKRFGVAQGTVRNALALLRGEGLVVAEHGRGVYVRARPRLQRRAYDRFTRKHREAGKAAYMAESEAEEVKPRVEVYFVGPEVAESDVARRLGLAEGSRVLRRSRRYFSDEQPTELATSYIPWELAEGTPMVEENPGPGGVYARIEEAGHRLDHFDEEISARMPTPEEAQALRLAAGSPVLTLVRAAYDTTGRVVEICDTVMSAEMYLLHYRLPAD